MFKYRPEIDGLRAIAVLCVIFFHAGFNWFRGGFVGVDVFFVISGYLITSLILRDLASKEFSLQSFYVKRARRILPMLIFVSLITAVISWVIADDLSLRKIGTILIGISLFAQNITLWKIQGYWDTVSDFNPLIHTWSLAVEEQFYFVFPIILSILFGIAHHKSRIKFNTKNALVFFCIISFISCEYGAQKSPSANFYFPITRAWELLVGSIAAFGLRKVSSSKSNLFCYTGLALVLIPVFFYDKTTPYPSHFTLTPVLGTFLIIAYCKNGIHLHKFLCSKALVKIGLLSYSAYLWHQPIFAYSRLFFNEISIGKTTALVLITLTFIISWLSWKYIETPFRQIEVGKKRNVFKLSFLALLFLGFLGCTFKFVSNNLEFKTAKRLSQNSFVYFDNMDERKFTSSRLMLPLQKVEAIFVGSSRIAQVNSAIYGDRILNLNVSGASSEDLISLSLEAAAKLRTKKLFIAGDPWIFNLNRYQTRYLSINNLYLYWLDVIENNLQLTPFYNTKNVPEPSFLDNHPHFFLRNFILAQQIPLNGSVEATAKRAYDGHHIYGQSFHSDKSRAHLTFDRQVNYSLTDFEYDRIAERNYMLLIDYLNRQGIETTIILSPYHPDLYDRIKASHPIYDQMEDKFRQIAKLLGLKVLGSYSTFEVGCDINEFYDGMHPTSSCMEKVINYDRGDHTLN